MKKDPLKEFAQMMAEQLKKSSETPTISIIEEVKLDKMQVSEKPNLALEVSKYLSQTKSLKEDIKSEHDSLVNTNHDNIPRQASKIESQRWNDPLKSSEHNFVTMKQMNDHYGAFLGRIQQQMSSIGGGGEVNFRGLDDVSTSTTGTNKFLTYNPSTKKYYFDYAGPATETEIGGIIPGPGFTISNAGMLGLNAGPSFYLDESGMFQLRPGTSSLIGGIKAGPGVVIDSEGTLLIDTAGLPFTFGDFTGLVGTYSSNTSYALLSSVNPNEDIVIATSGTGNVSIVGEFLVYATDTSVTDAIESFEPIFQIKPGGKIQMLVPAADTTTGAFEIVGNNSGNFHPTNQTGVIMHTTGNTGVTNRIYHDANNNYPIVVGRRYNGVVGALENVKSGEVIFRIAGQASTGTNFETFGPAKINWMATEDQGPNNQGGKITFDVTANGTNAFNNTITALEVTPEGILSTVGFVGNISGTTGDFTSFTGKYKRTVRNAGIITDGGSLLIDFATDSIVKCEWDNTVTINYTNYIPGSVVKVLAFKRVGTGTDNFSLDGITPGHTSTGSTTVAGTAGQTNFVEFTCIGTTLADVYAKL